MIKTTPMIFNSEMVRALLAGNKTQTRRPVADWQLPKDTDPQGGYNSLKYMSVAQRGKYGYGLFGSTAEKAMNNYNDEYNCENPFGRAGSLIYVRETIGFSENGFNDIAGQYCIEYKADDGCGLIDPTIDNNDYMANLALKKGNTRSNHMPRWASRLTLKIASVRVERIQDISEEDAKKEGAFFTDYGRKCFHSASNLNLAECPAPQETHPLKSGWNMKKTTSSDDCLGTARSAFLNLWNSIYPNSLDKNEWVWVIDFEVIHKNVDLVLAEMEQTS